MNNASRALAEMTIRLGLFIRKWASKRKYKGKRTHERTSFDSSRSKLAPTRNFHATRQNLKNTISHNFSCWNSKNLSKKKNTSKIHDFCNFFEIKNETKKKNIFENMPFLLSDQLFDLEKWKFVGKSLKLRIQSCVDVFFGKNRSFFENYKL